jgi:hypothetical protein
MDDKPFDQRVSGMLNKGLAAAAAHPSTVPPPEKMNDEALADFVSTSLSKLAAFSEKVKPYYLDLRKRFHEKPKGKKIYGCRTWDEYCTKVLERTRRAVNYFLAGGNPDSKAGARSVKVLRKTTGNVYLALSQLQPTTKLGQMGNAFPTRPPVVASPEPSRKALPTEGPIRPHEPDGEIVDQAFHEVRKLIGGLRLFLSCFESVNKSLGWAAVEPEKIRERLEQSEVKTLVNFKDWTERILRA